MERRRVFEPHEGAGPSCGYAAYGEAAPAVHPKNAALSERNLIKPSAMERAVIRRIVMALANWRVTACHTSAAPRKCGHAFVARSLSDFDRGGKVAIYRRERRSAFTLMELLTSLGIIAVLFALLLPAVQSAREAARRTQCRSNMKQIALALHNYHDVHGTFPINTSYTHDVGPLSQSRSWMQGILPYIEQTSLHERIRPAESIGANRAQAEHTIPLFCCSSDTHDGRFDRRADVPEEWTLGVTNYKANAGSNWGAGTFRFRSQAGRFALSYDGCNEGNGLICEGRRAPVVTRLRDVTDGASQSFAAGETVVGWTKWAWWYSNNAVTATCAIPLNHWPDGMAEGEPSADWPNAYGFASRHRGGGHFATTDGGVRFVSDGIDLATYHSLATISGAEVVSGF